MAEDPQLQADYQEYQDYLEYQDYVDTNFPSEAGATKEPWNLTDAVKQFGAGAVEGVAGIPALAADVASMAGFGPKTYEIDPQTGELKQSLFAASEATQGALDTVLPERDPNYRYSRTIGSFAAPTGALGLVGKGGGLVKGLMSGGGAAVDAVGAQFAEDTFDDTAIAPLVGAIATGGIRSGIAGSFEGIGKAIKGPTEAEIKGSAAKVVKSAITDPDALETALVNRPKDALGREMTTAELVDNAGMAQLQQELTMEGKGAQMLKDSQDRRQAARELVLRAGSNTKRINRERLGSDLIAEAEKNFDDISKLEDEAFDAFRNVGGDIEIGRFFKNQAPVAEAVGEVTGNGQRELSGYTRSLVDEFTQNKTLPARNLQNIRSSALEALRDTPDGAIPRENIVLAALAKNADEALDAGLSGPEKKLLDDARAITKEKYEIFGKGTVGGDLLSKSARPSTAFRKAFKGDDLSADQLLAAVGTSPTLRANIDQMIVQKVPRTGPFKRLSPVATMNYFEENENGIRKLMGDKGANAFGRVIKDLQLEAKVADNATRASRGQSVTAQKQKVGETVAGALAGVLTPGGAFVSRVGQELRGVANLKSEDAIKDLLIKVVFNPEFAVELAKTPTTQRVMSALDRLTKIATDARNAGARGGALELARDDDKETKKPTYVGAVGNPAKGPSGLVSGDAPQSVFTPAKPPSSVFRPPANQAAASVEPTSFFLDEGDMKKQTPIDDVVLDALRHVESGGNPNAVSPVGARGPYQFMPATAKRFGLKDPTDEKSSRKAAQTYLNWLYDRYGSLEFALAGFNAGEGNLDDAIARAEKAGEDSSDWDVVKNYLIGRTSKKKLDETIAYVPKILKQMKKYQTTKA